MSKSKIMLILIVIIGAVMLLPGCCFLQPSEPVEAKPIADADKKPVKMNEKNGSTVIYPCSDCGVLKVYKEMPSEVGLNKQFEYYIKVLNLTDQTISEVKIHEHLADNFKFVKSDPEAKADGKTLMWSMDKLGAKEMKKIKIMGMATSGDGIKHCTNATYKMPACAMTKVVQPMLSVTKTAPEMVLLCDRIPLKYTVSNAGSGATTGVMIKEQLPEGMMKVGGGNMVNISVGTLMPGESKSFDVMAMAEKTGKYGSKAMAMADDDMKADSAETMTTVKQPVLAIEKKGRDMVYLGRNVSYDISVSNKGDAEAADTVVEDMMPAGAKFVSATMGGKAVGNKVVWEIGSLAPGASKSMSVTYMPSDIGKVGGKAMAMAECAKAVDSSAMTEVKGIAAVLLEVIDISDPIEVGSNETYRIIVTNQGTATATNIKMMATLEESMEFVSGSGATMGSLSGQDVKFATLKTLAPKAKATWNVTVKAVQEGDVRFKAVLDCDQLERPVSETESTHFYK